MENVVCYKEVYLGDYVVMRVDGRDDMPEDGGY